MGSLFSIIIVLVVLGLVLYLIQMLPIDAKIKQIINVLVIVAIIVWLLQGVFLGGGVSLNHNRIIVP